MLVGDIVMAIREAITDNPQVLPAPHIDSVTTIVGDGTLGAGTFFIVATFTTPWGETLPSAEQTVVIAGPNSSIQVVLSLQGFGFGGLRNLGPLSGANLYIGLGAGQEITKYSFPGALTGSVLTVSAAVPVSFQAPPENNSSYIPDSDGDAVSASSMFRWINDALKLASTVCGGLLDYSGIGSVSGQPQYIVPGQWKKISSLWYDGYPLDMDDAGNYFRRNAITASVLSSVALSLFTDRMMFEVWPQPSRTAAQTTLAAPFNIGDTQAVLTSVAGFLLTNGFVKIGNEICSYSGIVGNTLKNLIRALSGTVAASVNTGLPVSELNMFWQGWRMYAPTFAPGSSMQSIPVPVGWETMLPMYGLARMKLAEQNVAEYEKLKGMFVKDLSEWFRTNKVVVGPKQVPGGWQGANGLETWGSGQGGGFVIP
jgi:hypothetical protein